MLGERYSKLAGAEAWAAFLFTSYLSGHLIFLLGSWLDEFYDWRGRPCGSSNGYGLHALGYFAVKK